MFVGEKGYMLLPHVGAPKLLPEKDFADVKIESVPGESHWHQWVNACLGEGKASANFDYAGPLTEWVLLGVLANRYPKRKLAWNAGELKITNDDEPNAIVRRTYRKGWETDRL